MKDFTDKVIELIKSLPNENKGKVIFTMHNKESNNHRTFRIQKSDFADGKLVIGLLQGADNEDSYINFGFVDPDTGIVSIWKRCTSDSTYPKYGNLITKLFLHVLPEKLNVSHAGKCFKCGRTLTTPESIESGIGPVCQNY